VPSLLHTFRRGRAGHAVDSGCRRPVLCPTVVGMRTGPLLAAAALLLALAGCVPTAPHPSASPSASATPAFASDAETLAAAEKAYAAYESAVDRSLQTTSTIGLAEVAMGDALKTARSSVNSFQRAGRTQRGNSRIEKVTGADLSALTAGGTSGDVAQIYACLDVSMVEVLDATGASVSVPGRQTIFPTLVSLAWSSKDGKLLVSEESVWDGKNFCA
jgi:hypothetical protein